VADKGGVVGSIHALPDLDSHPKGEDLLRRRACRQVAGEDHGIGTDNGVLPTILDGNQGS
jgi:hypothetical protein